MRDEAEQPAAADELRQWLGDNVVPPPSDDPDADGTVARRAGRRVTVATAIAAPWVVVLVAVLSGAIGLPAAPPPVGETTSGPAPASGPAEPASGPAGPAGPGPAEPGSAEPPTEPAEPVAGSGEAVAGSDEPAAHARAPVEPATGALTFDESTTRRDRDGPAAAGPLAVGVVRDAVTHVDDTTATALDIAAAEPAHRLADTTWIVRVHAVVLHGDRRRWRSASHEVWAVPIGSRGGAAVALDRPWRVRRGALPTTSIRWAPADVPIDDVRAALRRAGFGAPPDLVVERHPNLAGVLRATARTRMGRTHVWLGSTPSLAVLGSDRATTVRP